MRLDPVLDSFYLLSSLWGGLTSGQICISSAPVLPGATREAVWTLAPKPSATVTAFVNVTVIPMDTERVLPNHTVLVEGGRITAVGPASRVKVPAGAVQIDGRGKYLMPGLGDMHVHSLGAFDIKASTRELTAGLGFGFLADGVTSVRHMHEGSPISQAQIDMIRAGEVLSPRVYASGIQIGSPSSLTQNGKPVSMNAGTPGSVLSPNQRVLDRRDSATAYVAAAKAAGYNVIHAAANDVYARDSFPMTDSILTAARRLGVIIASHDHERSFEKTLSLGAFSGAAEHTSWLARPLKFFLRDSTLTEADADAIRSKIPAVMSIVKAAGVWVTPTLNCTETKYAPPELNLTLLRQLVKSLHDAGVGLLLSGDDGKSVHGELLALVRAGLTPYQALRTGTYNVAQYMGLLDSVGTVAVGKWADLVLYSDNPLNDIRVTREPAGVMTAGRWLDRTALDRGVLAFKAKSATKSWIMRKVLYNGIDPSPTKSQRAELQPHVERFEALTDSLVIAKSIGQDGESTAKRIRQLMVGEFVAMRGIVTPEQHRAFDSIVSIWLREEARQGRPTTVPGVASKPENR